MSVYHRLAQFQNCQSTDIGNILVAERGPDPGLKDIPVLSQSGLRNMALSFAGAEVGGKGVRNFHSGLVLLRIKGLVSIPKYGNPTSREKLAQMANLARMGGQHVDNFQQRQFANAGQHTLANTLTV
jgi:hypothetical protein